MAFSEKQNLFIDYLLERIGFKEDTLISNYKTKIELVYGRYHKESKTVTHNKGYSYQTYNYYRYSNKECIEEILKEIDIKKNLGSIILLNLNENSKISATDLSSYDFCPASFSINKSFKIEHPTKEPKTVILEQIISTENEDFDTEITEEKKRIIGINLHETLRLIDKKIPKEFNESDFFEYHISENSAINKIKNCELIFAGHTNENIFFKNQSKNFIGQPDYIFKDPNGKYFVVEEKFKYLSNHQAEEIDQNTQEIKSKFFSNHIVQLASYLNFIKGYELDYGILIYWFYDFNNKKPYVHSVSIKVIKKNEYSKLLKKTLSNIEYFLKNKEIDFKKNINPNKCGGCVVNKYCAHKTGELNTLKIPYNRYDLKLKFATFPEELKKPKEEDEPEV